MPSSISAVGRRPWLLIGSIFLVVAIGMLVGGAIEISSEVRYQSEGRISEGIVLAKHVRPASAQSSTEYSVSYRFTLAEDRVLEGSGAVSVARWEELTEGGPILVEYLASDPSQHRLYPTNGWGSGAVALALAGVLGLVGGSAAIHGWRHLRLERRLLRDGLMARATVVAIEPGNVRFNGQYLWHVRYRYQDRHGQSHAGQSGYMSREEAFGWQPGDIGGVRYDAMEPQLSIWTGGLLPSSTAE